MLTLQFSFVDNGQLEVLVADASIAEGYAFSADITDFPVEDGANVSDNVRNKPETLRVEAFFSDAPLPNTQSKKNQKGTTIVDTPVVPGQVSTSRSQDALNTLIFLKERGTLIDIETGVRRFTNMVIQDIDFQRTKDIAKALRVNLTFKQIRIVQTETVVLERKVQQSKKLGNKTTDKKLDAPEDLEQRSLLSSFLKGI